MELAALQALVGLHVEDRHSEAASLTFLVRCLQAAAMVWPSDGVAVRELALKWTDMSRASIVALALLPLLLSSVSCS